MLDDLNSLLFKYIIFVGFSLWGFIISMVLGLPGLSYIPWKARRDQQQAEYSPGIVDLKPGTKRRKSQDVDFGR